MRFQRGPCNKAVRRSLEPSSSLKDLAALDYGSVQTVRDGVEARDETVAVGGARAAEPSPACIETIDQRAERSMRPRATTSLVSPSRVAAESA